MSQARLSVGLKPATLRSLPMFMSYKRRVMQNSGEEDEEDEDEAGVAGPEVHGGGWDQELNAHGR